MQDAETVHVYWPIAHRREIDTRGLIARLRRADKKIVLPVVMEFGTHTTGKPRMEHRLWKPGTALRPNRWGVHEPEGDTAVPMGAIDLVIVPAFAADRDGQRIGHGYGYYDEFLEDVAALKVGLVYDACLFDLLPHESHDVPLDIVITEQEVWKPERL